MSVITGRETEGFAYFCPKCQSPSVRIPKPTILGSEQAGVPAHCNACSWEGPPSELIAAPFKHEFKDDTEIAETMAKDLRTMLAATAAQTYGRFLLKWGFLDQPITTAQLGRYMTNIAKAVITSVVETRKQMTEEKSGG